MLVNDINNDTKQQHAKTYYIYSYNTPSQKKSVTYHSCLTCHKNCIFQI